MRDSVEVLCAGIVVADHVCTPVAHLPAAGELVMADGMLLTIGGCAANAAVDLAKMGVRAAVVGRVGADVCGRVVTDMLREAGVDVSGITASPTAATSQTLIVNVQGQDRRFIHTFGANAEFAAADIPEGLVERCRVLYVGGYLVDAGIAASRSWHRYSPRHGERAASRRCSTSPFRRPGRTSAGWSSCCRTWMSSCRTTTRAS